MNSAKNVGEKLPDGWVLCQSKSIPGRKYYFNKKTGKSSWSQPQEDEKSSKKVCKKEKLKKQEKKKREEQAKKGAKRKNDSNEDMASKKRMKHDTSGAGSSKKGFTTHNEQRRNESPRYTSTPKTTPSKSAGSKSESLGKKTPVKNLANARLSQLRALLNSDIQDDEDSDISQKKLKISPKSSEAQKRSERKSPNLNDSRSTQSPNSDSFQSMPSPSQFLAANKIISSMKAQLPEEYCCKEKQKDTFADIEKGICSKTTEYPFSKHPATPPQFSEASKLVSAIKSKLAYKVSSSKDPKSYSSAKERMERLRTSLSLEAEQELNSSSSFMNTSVEDSKNMSEAMEIEDVKEVKPKSPPIQKENLVNNCDGNNLVLVVDTNIFIHELDFTKNVLNSHIKGYSEQPTLLVPWRVINELDRLKDNNNGNGALCKRAKAAMDYLYKSLPENSRIKGQSLRDSNSHIYPCEVPDDEILNCSLQQVERGRNVILLTNDKNLGNKATINGVKRISVKELKELIENKPQPSNPDLLTSVKHYQQTLYHLLANVLENEMRAKYNNLWQHVLFKVPPWTLADVLQCLLKHWVAVFNEVFPRIEMLLADLKNSLASIEKKNPNTLTQSEVANFKELCLDVAKKCQIIPEYMELAKLTVERLLKACEGEREGERQGERQEERRGEIQGERSWEVQGMQGERWGEMQGERRVEAQVEGRGEMQGETADADNKDVVEAFEGIWTVLSSYGAKLLTALGIEHSIVDNLPGAETLPELSSKLEQFTGCVNDLISAIDGVLEAGPNSETVQRLQRALAAPAHAPAPAAARLAAFCAHCRNMLQEAHNKLSQLAELLNVCRSRFSMNV